MILINDITIIRYIIALLLLSSCNSENGIDNPTENDPENQVIDFYFGADLSYVNEMEDCGAIYKNLDGETQDVYSIFKGAGTNLIRVRLWHNPSWTNYSNYNDVVETIQRAKALNMSVLLDFHYSDTWADPLQQEIPAAWASEINNLDTLKELLYSYTYDTLDNLASLNLLPDIVQIGNEINPMILQQGELTWPIDWTRNATLINRAIEAVRDIALIKNETIEVMLHIAQPENALWWFEQATENDVTDFDWIGLSYYPIWSEYNLNNVHIPFSTLINTYDKKLMVVETAYPFTMENIDTANNILGTDALIDGYPASQQGQYNYLLDLHGIIKNAGGQGLVYWEPTWVSTNCSTLWAQGSHWDNATLFDHNNQATLGMQFYSLSIED